MTLTETFTSTGHKFFAHQEAMGKLRNGKGQPIVTHVMLTDVCQHTCAFCSVQARAGDSLSFDDVKDYLTTLTRYGLKAVILSGGGNPILYKCKKTGADFNDVVEWVTGIMELEVGLITNGMTLCPYNMVTIGDDSQPKIRKSWKTVKPSTLDRLTWVRISMAGLDHDEREVYVPDIDHTKTTLGFSYVAHDIYREEADLHHGKVSRPLDLLSGDRDRMPTRPFDARIPQLTQQITKYCLQHNPRYVRLLPNCLEPSKIKFRCEQLQHMAHEINAALEVDTAFVQYKPPAAPKACYLGYVHPVLNTDGFVYPCDSCVLNEDAGHKFSNPWRVCHWSEVAKIYDEPVRSLIDDPKVRCPGCVFTHSNEILGTVVDGTVDLTPLPVVSEHGNFV